MTRATDTERFRRVKALFQTVCELTPARRAAYLDRECRTAPDVRAEVEAWLEHDREDGFLEPPAAAPVPTTPERVGSYAILGTLGAGGMGVVYRASQETPRRTVALKVVRVGLPAPRMLRRFEHEAELLGRLQHPGIAQIFEAGTADAGGGPQPYFAMELVEGRPLVEYAAEQDLRGRVALLVRVCDAVQHAHQKGVIHCDLKPGNILVDATGQPKVLDFGVARAIDSDLQRTTLRAEVGQVIGTLPYMSPEQVAGDPRELDTRSDVYALGVIAHEVLTGTHPFDLEQKSMAEAMRTVREDDPAPLGSTRRELRGDLQTIVAKALEKDKTRRYASSSALSADLARFLDHQPIAARPPSAVYQLVKFARRNRALVVGTLAFLAALVGGVITTSYQARRATHLAVEEERLRRSAEEEAATAKAMFEAFVGFLRSPDPIWGEGREVKAAAFLDRAAIAIEEEFADRPGIQAPLTLTVGQTYRGLGLHPEAAESFACALAVLERTEGPTHEDTLYAKNELVPCLNEIGRRDEAEVLGRELVGQALESLGEDHAVTRAALHNLAVVLLRVEEWGEAEELLLRVIELEERALGADTRCALKNRSTLGRLWDRMGRAEDAERQLTEVLTAQTRLLGADDADTLYTRFYLAQLHGGLERWDEAERMYVGMLPAWTERFGEQHVHTATLLNDLGVLMLDKGRLAEAESYLSRAISSRSGARGEEDHEALQWRIRLSIVYSRLGRLDEAEANLQAIVETRKRLHGPTDSFTILDMSNLAQLKVRRGQAEQARPLFEEAAQLATRSLPEDHFVRASVDVLHGACLARLDRDEEAETRMVRGYGHLRASFADHPMTGSARGVLIEFFETRGRPERAAELRDG